MSDRQTNQQTDRQLDFYSCSGQLKIYYTWTSYISDATTKSSKKSWVAHENKRLYCCGRKEADFELLAFLPYLTRQSVSSRLSQQAIFALSDSVPIFAGPLSAKMWRPSQSPSLQGLSVPYLLDAGSLLFLVRVSYLGEMDSHCLSQSLSACLTVWLWLSDCLSVGLFSLTIFQTV